MGQAWQNFNLRKCDYLSPTFPSGHDVNTVIHIKLTNVNVANVNLIHKWADIQKLNAETDDSNWFIGRAQTIITGRGQCNKKKE